MEFHLFSAPDGWVGVRFLRGKRYAGRAAIIPEARVPELLSPEGSVALAKQLGAHNPLPTTPNNEHPES